VVFGATFSTVTRSPLRVKLNDEIGAAAWGPAGAKGMAGMYCSFKARQTKVKGERKNPNPRSPHASVAGNG
jgi:hypothetical protein